MLIMVRVYTLDGRRNRTLQDELKFKDWRAAGRWLRRWLPIVGQVVEFEAYADQPGWGE